MMECSPGSGKDMHFSSLIPLKNAVRQAPASAGNRLRELRERRGLSQRELAQKVGVEPYTVISQLESGFGSIPADHYAVWVQALGIERGEFIRCLESNCGSAVRDRLARASEDAPDSEADFVT